MAVDLRSYLTYRCFQMLQMEHDVRDLYGLLWKEVENFEIKELFRAKRERVGRQLENLERALAKLEVGVALPAQGARALEAAPGVLALMAERGGHPVTQGMLQEHQVFMRLDPSPAVIQVHDLWEAYRIDHMEMVAYEELLGLAEELQEPEVVEVLKQSRQEEVGGGERLREWMRILAREYREGKRKAA